MTDADGVPLSNASLIIEAWPADARATDVDGSQAPLVEFARGKTNSKGEFTVSVHDELNRHGLLGQFVDIDVTALGETGQAATSFSWVPPGAGGVLTPDETLAETASRVDLGVVIGQSRPERDVGVGVMSSLSDDSEPDAVVETESDFQMAVPSPGRNSSGTLVCGRSSSGPSTSHQKRNLPGSTTAEQQTALSAWGSRGEQMVATARSRPPAR